MSFAKLISLFENSNIMTFIGYFFIFNILIIIFEVLLDLFTSKKRRWKDSLANLSIFIINQLLEKTIIGSIGIICLIPIYNAFPTQLPINIYTWLLAFFAADFTYYWMHRLEHKYRIFWASHSVHHSSEDYNLTIAMRLSIVEGLFEWIFLIPMILIGFSPFQAIVSLILVAQFQTWIHTERIKKLGWLDEVFNTPSVHRVHHGSNRKCLDKNYGGVFIIWDKLFGTFQREDEKVIYGLTQNIKTNNPITINFIEYKNIWNDVKRSNSLTDKLKVIFGRTGWVPKHLKNN